MSESIKKMDDIINSMVSWLNEYPRRILTKIQKSRLEILYQKISEAEPISLEDLKKLNSFEAKKIKNYNLEKTFSNPKNGAEYYDRLIFFICDGCKSKVLFKNKKKHRKKCKPWMKLHNIPINKITHTHSSKATNVTKDLPGRDYNNTDNEAKNQYLANREQDGSRDYYVIRENGKYGSMSSFDDYSDESNP